MLDNFLFVIILCISYTGVRSGEWCTEYSDDWFSDTNTIWCEQGCCGDSYDQYCCRSIKDSKTALIVGQVVESIVMVAIIVSILVAIFCCCRKSRGQAGQVFQPSGTNVATSTIGYGMVGYNGAINSAVFTSNMTPGSVQTWQQPPPPYDQMNKV